MPWSSNSQLPSQFKVLPGSAQTLFRKTFNSVFEKYGEKKAIAIAWSVVKKKFKKDKKGDWVAKSSDFGEYDTDVIMKSDDIRPKILYEDTMAKSLDADTTHFYADVVISNTLPDNDNHVVDEALIKQWVDKINTNPELYKADLEHINLRMNQGRKVENDIDPEDIVKTKSAKIQNGELILTVEFNKHHKNFKETWDRAVDGWLGASVEIPRRTIKAVADGKLMRIVSGELSKFTLSKQPSNRYTRFLRTWKAG